MSLAHFVESGHDLVNVGGINERIDGKVGFHSLNPSYSIRRFSREICGEGHLKFLGFRRYWCYWWCWWYEGLPWWCWGNSALSGHSWGLEGQG